MPKNKAGRTASGCSQQHAAVRLARFLADCSPEQQTLLQQMVQVRQQRAAIIARRTGTRKD